MPTLRRSTAHGAYPCVGSGFRAFELDHCGPQYDVLASAVDSCVGERYIEGESGGMLQRWDCRIPSEACVKCDYGNHIQALLGCHHTVHR